MRRRLVVLAAAVCGLFAVAAGAFGAHGFEGPASAERALWLEKASRYAMWHGLALLGAAALELATPAVALGFCGGTLLFSGSLTALAFGAPRAVAWITPLGGILFLAGWGALFAAALRARARGRESAADAPR